MRKVNTQLTAHYFVVVEVADRRCSSVCICEFSEAKTFWFASIAVIDKSKVEDLANLTKYVNNLFFGEA